jgi:uncharacterized membrane-anchored protein
MRASYPRSRARSLFTKVPQVAIVFWIIKVITTALGESTSDYLVSHFAPYIAVLGGFLAFLAAMVLQFSVRRYIPWVYWLAALMVAVFGTMAADSVHVALGVPYKYSALGFAVALAVIFLAWSVTEKTLSIHSIFTFRRELFYWLTVFATFALGTATGDLTATTFGWGYLNSGLIFAAVIASIAISFFVAKAMLGERVKLLNRYSIFAFWFAYIITRPLGASFADWMSKPPVISGLGWGDGRTSLLLLAPIVLLVAYLQLTHRDENAAAHENATIPPEINSQLLNQTLENLE